MPRGYYEDLRIVNENLRTSCEASSGPWGGLFLEDFLERFGLQQVLEGAVSKPRFCVAFQRAIEICRIAGIVVLVAPFFVALVKTL